MAWGNTNVYKLAMGKKYILSLLLFVFNWSIVVYTAVSVSAVHKVNQPYIYIFPLFGGSSFHLGYHRVLNKSSLCYRAGSHYLPTLYIRVCVCVCVCVYTHVNLPIRLTLCFLLGIHTSVLHICVSVSVLQIRSSIRPHFRTNRYLRKRTPKTMHERARSHVVQ